MFDAIIREISQRFGLGDKGQALIASLLALVFDPNSGGIAGLLEKFRQQGLGDIFSSWLGGASGTPAPISTQQVENVLGSSALNGIANRLGIAPGTVLAAASAALPKIVGAVTPNGQLPSGIPAGVGGLLGSLGGGIGGIGAAAASSAAAATTRVTNAAEGAAAGGLGWLKWLVLAAIILALAYCVMTRTATAPAPSPPTTNAPAKPAVPAVVQNAAADAKAALLALVPGKYTAADLVNALNQMAIHFDTGAANISADSLDMLTAAAAAIKAAPAGTKVEIGGHTDNTGDPASNLQLSEARANAVRAKLIELGVAADSLTAKGYGDTKPVADNGTEEGKAKNRRMEFTVLP